MRHFAPSRNKGPVSNETIIDLDAKERLLRNSHLELIPLKNLDAQLAFVPPASSVTVTCSPVKGIAETLSISERLLAMGHHVVPHIAARLVEGPAHVESLARWFRANGVEEFFLVGGDAEEPAGPYGDAASFLTDLLALDTGLQRVGYTAYPDGHAFIPSEALSDALHEKQAILAAAGVEGYVSTQMCFDVEAIMTWLENERARGFVLPVNLGIPGAVEKARLMKMGVRLGIGTSLRFLKKNRAAVTKMLAPGTYDPLELLDPLSPHAAKLGIAGVHIFTFNAVESTVAWRNAQV